MAGKFIIIFLNLDIDFIHNSKVLQYCVFVQCKSIRNQAASSQGALDFIFKEETKRCEE